MSAGNDIGLSDSRTRALEVIDYPHHEVHRGDHYFVSETRTPGAGSSFEWLIVTPNSTTWSHFILVPSAKDVGIFALYEGTAKAGGTAITERCSDRNGVDANAGLVWTYTPGAGADGTLIRNWYIPAAGPAVRDPGEGRAQEIILKANTSYLLRWTPSGGGAVAAFIDAEWYNHANYP